jgi:protein arginine kinase activator
MLCEDCNKLEADTQFVEIIDGRKVVRNLCSKCAERRAMGLGKGKVDEPLIKIKPPQKEKIEEEIKEKEGLVCPGCGMTYEEFKKVAKFGCAKCYDAFETNLLKIFKEIHGSNTYRGRPYKRDSESAGLVKRKRELEKALEIAIKNENFEDAAKIRDELKELQEKLKWN